MTLSTPTNDAALNQAIAACDRIECGLRTAAARAQRAIEEAFRELQRMVEAINADHAARGVAPLEVNIAIPEESGLKPPRLEMVAEIGLLAAVAGHGAGLPRRYSLVSH